MLPRARESLSTWKWAQEDSNREASQLLKGSGLVLMAARVVALVANEVAASGGYYLAMAGDKVLAQPTTITGSIGVIIPTMNVSQGLAKIGIVSRSVKSGANKDLANPLEPMREGQYAVLQHMVDDFYAKFRALVTTASRGAVTDAELG